MSKQSDIDYLVAKGLPEVYAHMAVEAPGWRLEPNYYLHSVIHESFVWYLTEEGLGFWYAIWNNVQAEGL
jgi:hypothetical protein